jgi:hypothetical protein
MLYSDKMHVILVGYLTLRVRSAYELESAIGNYGHQSYPFGFADCLTLSEKGVLFDYGSDSHLMDA